MSSKPSSAKHFVFAFLGFIFAIVFVLAAFEIILRIDGRYRLYHELNNQPYASQYTGRITPEHLFRHKGVDSVSFSKKEFTEIRKINTLGFTDHREVHEIDTTAQTVRILALGDSFTEGMGAEYEEAWPHALEQLLNEEAGEEKYIVYNAGVSGCDPFFSFKNMEFLAPQLHPHIVILLMNTTDYTDVYFRGGFDRFQANDKVEFTRKAPWWEWYYSKSHAVRAFVEWAGYNIFLTRDPYERAIQSSFPVIETALDSFRMYCASRNIDFIPVFNPIPTYHSEEQYRQDSVFVYQFVAPQNPRMLDLTQAVRTHRTAEYFWQSDNHCTAKGYHLFAETIAEHMRKIRSDLKN